MLASMSNSTSTRCAIAGCSGSKSGWSAMWCGVSPVRVSIMPHRPRDRRRRLVRVQDLLGRRVRTADGQVVGRIEEIRAERRGDDHELIEYRLGTGALLERFALAQRLFGRRHPRIVARWDQLDIREP